MAFTDFTFPEVVDTLGLTLATADLFGGVAAVPVDPGFARRLASGVSLASALRTQKSRSEFIIAPTLVELWDTAPRKFGLFAGAEFRVSPADGLTGFCDFLITRDPLLLRITAPMFAVVEAKFDSLWDGFGQCVAEMVAAQRFNERTGGPQAPVYGCVTAGLNWKFLRLAGPDLTVDAVEYFISDPGKILAILLDIVGDQTPTPSTTLRQ